MSFKNWIITAVVVICFMLVAAMDTVATAGVNNVSTYITRLEAANDLP